MFYTDISQWTFLADKYAVRQYVSERIGDKYLVPLLGKWNHPEEIDFEALPSKFVMKPNNGCYDTIICREKSAIDIGEIRRKMRYAFFHKFGYENAEPHYVNIPPCIIAEDLLESTDVGGLIDYKIWCFDGKPYGVFICANRNEESHHADFVYYDLKWTRRQEFISPQYQNDLEFNRPENFEEMLSIATRLATGHPQVRVDLYNVNGKIYFGEMTFSSNFGMMPYFTPEALEMMGNQITLPKRTSREKVCTFFKRWFPNF